MSQDVQSHVDHAHAGARATSHGTLSRYGSSPRDSPSMVGRRCPQGEAEKKRYVPINPLAVKHKTWYSDCPGMVGHRPRGEDESQPKSDAPKAGRPRSKKAEQKHCMQLSTNEKVMPMLPEQLLASISGDEQLEVSQLRKRVRSRLQKQAPGSAFITMKELEKGLHNPSFISAEQFRRVAEEELMALAVALGGEFQLAYTDWQKEKDQSRQNKQAAKFEKYLERQEADITRRREKVLVVEEATDQYLDGIMQRKAKRFWPTRAFMREMNMRVKKKLSLHGPTKTTYASAKKKINSFRSWGGDPKRKPQEKEKKELNFSAF